METKRTILQDNLKKDSGFSRLEENLTLFCYTACAFIIIFLSQTLILTLLSLFKLHLMLLSSVTSFILAGFFSRKIKKDIDLLPSLSIPAISIIILVLSIFVFFPHDTFGGRDESLFSNYAVYLGKSGSLNFPAYLPNNYVKDIRGRLPAYTVWLAIQGVLFGNEWLLKSNVILVGLGLCSLYLVATIFGGKLTGLITVILYASSMPFLWFARETLTENLSFFLVWSLILFLFTFMKTKNFIYIVALLIGGWVLSLTRIEGFFIQISSMFTIISILLIKKTVKIRKIFFIFLASVLLILSSLFIIRTLSFDSYFAKSITSTKAIVLDDISNQLFGKTNLTQTKREVRLGERFPNFFLAMIGKYNFILVFFSIIYLAVNTLFKRKKGITTKLNMVILLFVISPEFLKFINPTVTADQPWMYRRYVYALLPLGYLSLTAILNQQKKSRVLASTFILFFIVNILLSNKIIFLKNNWLLVNKMETITKNISKDDLVIIKNRLLGDYSPNAFLLIQRGIKYVVASTLSTLKFDPDRKMLDNTPYNKLYLLSDKKDESYPDFKVIMQNNVELEYKQLQYSCQLFILGEYLQLYNVYDYSKLPYSEVMNYCRQSDNEIINYKEKLYLYELTYTKF